MDIEPQKAPDHRGAGPARRRGGSQGPNAGVKATTAEDQGRGEEAEDAVGEEELREGEGADEYGDGENGDGVELAEWDEMYVNPLHVRFTQDKIHPFFYRRGPIVNVLPKIRPVSRTLISDCGSREEEVVELVPPFTPIHCLKKGEELWALDNRRLYAMQLAALELWPRRCRMRVLSRDRLPRHKFKTQYRKFSTTSEGTTISVCARYQQFDTWSWYERAVELEWYIFSQRLGSLLLVFEIVPVIGALLFRTGMTGFASRLPLVAAFALTFGAELLRQRVPVLERRISELHVQAVMDGEVQPFSPCWRRCQALVLRVTGGEEEPNAGPMSPLQLSATIAVVLLLLLPYFMGVARARLRSSLLSVWLGIACVLAVQLGHGFRAASAAPPRWGVPNGAAVGAGGGGGSTAAAGGEEGDEGDEGAPATAKLTPKGRD